MVLRMFKMLFGTMDLWTVITSLVRKTGPICLTSTSWFSGRLADKNMGVL